MTVNTTVKYHHKQPLNEKLKLMGEVMKFFPKKLLCHEIFNSLASWATNIFFGQIYKTLQPLPLNIRSLNIVEKVLKYLSMHVLEVFLNERSYLNLPCLISSEIIARLCLYLHLCTSFGQAKYPTGSSSTSTMSNLIDGLYI